MSGYLPEWIDPLRLVDQRAELYGALALSRLTRLAGLLSDQEGEVDVRLSFAVDAGGFRMIEGRLQAELRQVCQRCLQPVAERFDLPVRLAIVRSEQEADRLPGDIEPLLVGHEPVRLADIVEDELMLALPVVPMHAGDANCEAVAGRYRTLPEVEQDRSNPFDVLSTLRDKKP